MQDNEGWSALMTAVEHTGTPKVEKVGLKNNEGFTALTSNIGVGMMGGGGALGAIKTSPPANNYTTPQQTNHHLSTSSHVAESKYRQKLCCQSQASSPNKLSVLTRDALFLKINFVE